MQYNESVAQGWENGRTLAANGRGTVLRSHVIGRVARYDMSRLTAPCAAAAARR